MANTVQTRTLVDGQKYAVVHVFIESDGVSGELTDTVVVDVSALATKSDGSAVAKVTVEEIWASFTGCSGKLEFDATTDAGIWSFAADHADHVDMGVFGGLPDPLASGTTGDILLTTNGFTAAGDRASLIIKVRKD